MKKGSQIELPQPQGEIEDYIQILQEHQLKCQNTGKYIEAEMAKNRVSELKKELEFQKKDELKQKQIDEKVEIEKAHLNEFNEFNSFWDSKMLEFDEEAQQIEEQTIKRQEEELESFEKELEESLPQRPKDSSELLNLRKVEESLAKQSNYIEAHKVQQQALQLEEENFEKWQQQRKQKIRNQLIQVKLKQDYELNALRQRITAGQDEQRKVRSLELERLLQKYQNVKKELESQQQAEAVKLTKSLQNPGLNFSRYASQYQSSSRYSSKSQQQQQLSQQVN